MESKIKGISAGELRQLIKDIALIKEILFFNSNFRDPEGELSDWAKKELDESRKRKEKISHEEVKKIILVK